MLSLLLTVAACGGSTASEGTSTQDASTPPDAGLDVFLEGGVDPECSDGQQRACYTASALTLNVGKCRAGTQWCTGAAWGPCEGEVPPVTETCDHTDDDCDGSTDEGCACASGDTRSCYGGAVGTQDVGDCKAGQQQCEDGAWASDCGGEVTPVEETCDNADDDCDGEVDNMAPRACSTACGTGTETCAGGQWTNCTARSPVNETCNGQDDDCDGTTDEGCPTCNDGVKNQGEFDVDCGGPCPRCEWSGVNCAPCPWGYNPSDPECGYKSTCITPTGTTGRFYYDNHWQDYGNGCPACNIGGGVSWEIWTE